MCQPPVALDGFHVIIVIFCVIFTVPIRIYTIYLSQMLPKACPQQLTFRTIPLYLVRNQSDCNEKYRHHHNNCVIYPF